jgi:hypothetical protein
MNPGGRREEGAWQQRTSEGEGPGQASLSDSPPLQPSVRHHEHCPLSPGEQRPASAEGGCSGGERGYPRRHLGQRKPRTLPRFWVSSPHSPLPHQDKPRAGNLTPTGLQIKNWQKCDSTSMPVTDGPLRHVQKPRRYGRPPLRKPQPGPPRGLPPPHRDRTPSHPQRDRTSQSGSRGAPRSAPASRGWRVQTSANKRVVCKRCGTSGRAGPAGSQGSAPSLLPRARAQVETQSGGHSGTQPGPRPQGRPGPGSTDFAAAARLARPPACALTSLTPAPGARLSAGRNYPTQREGETRRKRENQQHSAWGEASPARRRAGLPPAGGRDAHAGTSAPGHPSGGAAARPGVAYCARLGALGAGPAPSPPALAKSSGYPPRVRRAHALLPAPSALYRAAPGEEEIDLSLPELFATRPFNRPRPGCPHPPPPRARPTAAAWALPALCGRCRGPGHSAAACRSRAACGSGGRVCRARSRRWAGSGGVAARRRQD